MFSQFGLDRREVRAWVLYDWANSAFWSTVVTAVFPEFFSTVAAAGLPRAVATARFAAITTVYLFIAIPWEERSLLRIFGEPYARYQRTVRWRIIPYVY